MEKLTDEIRKSLLTQAIDAPLVLPSKHDSFLESLKLVTDDCELAAQYFASEETRKKLRLVCSRWRKIIDKIQHDTWVIIEEADCPPSASRVQLPGGCECGLPHCHMNIPPSLRSYNLTTATRPLKAFIETATSQARDVMQLVQRHPTLRVLGTSVDLRDSESVFSLSEFSRAARNLTHLSLSEFNLPAGPRLQVLDLPQLYTLALSFYCPVDSISQRGVINHPSFHEWNLPRLRNLSLRGGVWDSDTQFLQQIYGMIHRVGPTLEGLFYNPWVFSSSRVDTPYPLPKDLWTSCPHLHSIQTSIQVLFSVPNPPLEHPRLTVVPVHIANLDTLPQIGHLLWPQELFDKFPWPTEWPIERFKISTSWHTFYRKLNRLHVSIRATTGTSRTRNEDPDYWPTYFAKLGDLFRERGFVVEDRYGGRLIDGACPELSSWLNEFRHR